MVPKFPKLVSFPHISPSTWPWTCMWLNDCEGPGCAVGTPNARPCRNHAVSALCPEVCVPRLCPKGKSIQGAEAPVRRAGLKQDSAQGWLTRPAGEGGSGATWGLHLGFTSSPSPLPSSCFELRPSLPSLLFLPWFCHPCIAALLVPGSCHFPSTHAAALCPTAPPTPRRQCPLLGPRSQLGGHSPVLPAGEER